MEDLNIYQGGFIPVIIPKSTTEKVNKKLENIVGIESMGRSFTNSNRSLTTLGMFNEISDLLKRKHGISHEKARDRTYKIIKKVKKEYPNLSNIERFDNVMRSIY
jgi:hypothetical protein